jgi:hypothetical protein
MVPDVALGLTEHFCDLVQRVAFDEVQPKGLLLVLRQGSEHFLQVQFDKPFVHCLIGVTEAGIRDFRRLFIELHPCVEMAGVQIAAPRNGTAIGHLDNPELD